MTTDAAAAKSLSMSPRRVLSARRRWLFRLIAIGLGLGSLGVLELVLLAIGFGHDLQLVISVPNAAGWYQLNPRFDEPFFGQTTLSGPDTTPFRLPKPAGTRRILVVGGSTVIGFPYTSDLAFPRLLQELLQEQATAGVRVEVLNAGITALNSSSEAAVVQEGVTCQPDLIVVYTGHNEFYGPGGVASGAGSVDPVWFRRLAYAKRLRLFQLARRLLVSRSQTPPDLMDKLSADRRITRDSPLFQQAVERFEQNLRAMQSFAAARNIPILFVGPACNERHQPPIEPALPRVPVPGEPPWHADVRKAEHWLRYDQPSKALPILQAAAEIASGSAIVEYRLGQTYDQLSDRELAAKHYAAAVEADGTRFRAPAAFREVMSQLAHRDEQHRAYYVDARAALIHAAEHGVPDETQFWEHVHFTWEGNHVLAKSLAEFIQREIWQQPWSEDRCLSSEALSNRLAVQPEEHLAAATLAMMIYEKPPFLAAADAAALAKRWKERTIDGVRDLPPARREVFMDLSTAEMAQDPLMMLERRFQAKGLDAEGETMREALALRRPWLCNFRGTQPPTGTEWPCIVPCP